MKFKIKRSADKQFYFVLVAKNGKTVAQSEMYKRKQNTKKGMDVIDPLGKCKRIDETKKNNAVKSSQIQAIEK